MQGSDTTPMQGAICGSISGAISSAVTTPLDVVKTRMMLGSKNAAGALGRPTRRSARRQWGGQPQWARRRAAWRGAAAPAMWAAARIARGRGRAPEPTRGAGLRE